MAEETTSTQLPIPRQLESPPRTTGSAQQDFPIIIDYVFRVYQLMQQAIAYINGQIEANPDITVTDLPNPATSTVAQAQQTANDAYNLAILAQKGVDAIKAIFATNVTGTVTINDLATGSGSITLNPAQKDTAYTVDIQAKATAGTPVTDSFIITGKTYNTGSFSFTIKDAPGSGNSITYEWRLTRNT